MTEDEKKTAVLVALVKTGIVDLDSLANGIVEKFPTDFDPDDLNPDLGGSSGVCVGRWYVLAGGID